MDVSSAASDARLGQHVIVMAVILTLWSPPLHTSSLTGASCSLIQVETLARLPRDGNVSLQHWCHLILVWLHHKFILSHKLAQHQGTSYANVSGSTRMALGFKKARSRTY